MHKVIAAVLLLACTVAIAQQPRNVSIIALIASPERYDGKQVVVSGFMFLQRERNALYISKADFQHALFKNAIYLQVGNNLFERIYRFNGCYVEVVGTFDGKNTGHVGAFSGELNVKQVQLVSTATVKTELRDNTDPASCK